jgi:hypothetical protein
MSQTQMRILRAIKRQVEEGTTTDPLDALKAISDHRRTVQQAVTHLLATLPQSQPKIRPYPAHNQVVQASWLDRHIRELEQC